MFKRITVAYSESPESRRPLDSAIGLAHHKTDLLVIGLHHLQSYISGLWSTVYGLAQNAPCSVLGVH
jgi:hypothetical protein